MSKFTKDLERINNDALNIGRRYFPAWTPIPNLPWLVSDATTGDYVRDKDGSTKRYHTLGEAIKLSDKLEKKARGE